MHLFYPSQHVTLLHCTLHYTRLSLHVSVSRRALNLFFFAGTSLVQPPRCSLTSLQLCALYCSELRSRLAHSTTTLEQAIFVPGGCGSSTASMLAAGKFMSQLPSRSRAQLVSLRVQPHYAYGSTVYVLLLFVVRPLLEAQRFWRTPDDTWRSITFSPENRCSTGVPFSVQQARLGLSIRCMPACAAYKLSCTYQPHSHLAALVLRARVRSCARSDCDRRPSQRRRNLLHRSTSAILRPSDAISVPFMR